MVRALHQRQPVIMQKPAHGDLQKRARGNMVAIKNRNKITLGDGQGMIEIACLGVAMLRANNIASAADGGELFKRLAIAII